MHGSKAMILAAGLGSRMGTLSDTLPKPLVQVKGITLLDRLLAHATLGGVQQTVVNVHHLADQIEAHLSRKVGSGQVLISDERDALLETGGGVKKALSLLGNDPFFVLNSDALWVDAAEKQLNLIRAAWQPKKMDVLLLLVPTENALGYDGVGDFFAGVSDPSSKVRSVQFRDDAERAPFMFGGVQLVEPSLYNGMPDGAFSNREIFRKAVAAGRLYGIEIDGHWMHVGTQEAIGEAEKKLNELGAA
ncbi:MAG: mannose-1-phosphate guanylyltransferase [Kordiimonadales bacterium]|nr:MAG: mannose-1-phosphate guanylyltransferase [Kordiimonadales bacterium]